MKLLWKQYGLVWIGTYAVLYFGGLAGIYVVLDTGLVASDVSLEFMRGAYSAFRDRMPFMSRDPSLGVAFRHKELQPFFPISGAKTPAVLPGLHCTAKKWI